MNAIISVNGELVPAADARISPYDRGLLYGDGLFETMRSYRGGIHLLRRHLKRLRFGTGLLGIPLPSDETITAILRSVIEANGGGDMVLRLTVTRGVGGSLFDLSAAETPTLLVMPRPAPDASAIPERLITLHVRRPRSGSGVTLKSLNYLPAIAAAGELTTAGVREGIMLTDDGWVAEGTVSNIFCLLDGAVHTPSPATGILEGITRGRVIELARKAGLEVIESFISLDQLKSCDECFYTNSARGIVMVNSIDDRQLKYSRTDDRTSLLQRLYMSEAPDEEL